MPASSLAAADGRWPQILTALAGLTPDQLSDRHQPCPACGGTDRYRWDSDDGLGGWYCNQCGGKNRNGGGGTGIDLLMRVRNWDFKTAARNVEQHLGVAAPTVHASPARPQRIPTAPPAGTAPPDLGKAKAQYLYTDNDGQLLFTIQRFDREDGGKFFVHRTWLDGAWHFPRKADGFDSSWPTPRPLYRLNALKRHPYEDVVVVEGEKAADAAASLLTSMVVVSWPNGSNAIDKIDWTPLKGRFVNLWPDNDEAGRKAMDAVGRKLKALGCTVNVIANPPDAEEGWDVADAIWTSTEAVDWVVNNRTKFKPKELLLPQLPQPPQEPQELEDDGKPFEMLGFRDDVYYYLPKDTGMVVPLNRAMHSANHLNSVARVEYWQTIYPGGRGGVDWQAVVSDLYKAQHAIGFFNPDKIRGRGAWLDRGRPVLHLGESIMLNGVYMPIQQRFDSSYHYQRGTQLAELKSTEPLSDAEALELQLLASEFNWEKPISAQLLAGWVTLAPICGALPWRPHIWLTAPAGSGKTTVLEDYVGGLLGDMRLHATGNSTEAFIRQTLRTDALPVMIDEAESNNPSEAQRIQSIIALARHASSESKAVQGRGSVSGEVTIYRIRSMFLLSSINTAVKGGADDRRFAQLTLVKKPDTSEERARWKDHKARIEAAITPEVSHRYLMRTVNLMPNIRKSIAVFSSVCAEHFQSQPLGDQYGTLLAGAWHMGVSEVATRANAEAYFNDHVDWGSHIQNDNLLVDQEACLQTILQTHLKVQNADIQNVDLTIYELCQMCARPGSVPVTSPITVDQAAAALGREGIKVQDGQVIISNTAEGIKRILRMTPWAINWPDQLRRLPGASRTSSTVHFPGAGSHRGTQVPFAA